MNNKIIALIAVVVVVVAGWLIYKHNASNVNMGMTMPYGTDNDTTATPAPTDTTLAPASTSTPATPTSKVDTFTVTGGNFFFSPKTLTVNKGDTVKINFVNSGGFHDFKIDEFNVATTRINGGQNATVTFVADKAGSFQYYCSVGDHRAMGMFGTLTVN